MKIFISPKFSVSNSMIPAHRSNYISKYGMVVLFMKILIAALLIQKNFFKNYKMSNYREMVK